MEVFVIAGKLGCERAVSLGAIAVVVDALRASATITVLLEKGVKKVFVTNEVDQAFSIASKIPNAILVGERNNIKIPGFHYGNTPSLLWKLPDSELKGRSVVFTSTSGARRINACKGATRILIGTSVNASSTAKLCARLAKSFKKPVVIIPACNFKNENEVSEEDMAAALEIAKRTKLPLKGIIPEFGTKRGLQEVFFSCKHGKELVSQGFKEDVEFCSKIDTCSKVGVVIDFFQNAAVLTSYGIIET